MQLLYIESATVFSDTCKMSNLKTVVNIVISCLCHNSDKRGSTL